MKTKQKGFTLIEILGAVTILGILSVIAIVSVSRIIEKSKERHYITAEDNLELAAQSYTQQNRNYLPKVIGQKEKIYLSELIDKNYIKQIKDYSGKECSNESYVQVFKYSQTEYSYLPYLDCGEDVYQSSSLTSKKFTPTITIDFTVTTSPIIEIQDSNKLMSYSYIIYKDDKEVKNSGNIELPNHDTKITKTISLAEYISGVTTLKLSVSATNIYGNSITVSDFQKYDDTPGTDTTRPQCVYINDEDKPDSGRAWTKEDRTITVKCDDGDGSGCTKKTYTKTFTNSVKNSYIIIADESGNKNSCKVGVYIDKIAPEISAVNNQNAGKWVNYSYAITLGGSDPKLATGDAGSGIKQWRYSYDDLDPYSTAWNPYSNSNKTSFTTTEFSRERDENVYLSVCDNAGNCSSNSTSHIRIDKIAPEISAVNNPNAGKWVNYSYAITLGGSDPKLATGAAGSGIKQWRYSYDDLDPYSTAWNLYSNSNKTSFTTTDFSRERDENVYISVCDNAGNCSGNSNSYIRIDKTKPIIRTTTNDSNSQWVNRNVTITATVDNPTSSTEPKVRSNLVEIYYKYSGKTSKYTDWNSLTQSLPSLNTTTVSGVWQSEREDEILIYAKDEAGNKTSGESAGWIKIDKTAPPVSYVSQWYETSTNKCTNISKSCTYNNLQNNSNTCTLRYDAIVNAGTCYMTWSTIVAEDQGEYRSGYSHTENKWSGSNCVQNTWTANRLPSCLDPLRSYTRHIRLCDKVGNCSNPLTVHINP